MQQQLDGKQDRLTFDVTPTAGSSNPVTSDGIFSFTRQAVFSNRQLFTANGTFTVPAGVTKIRVYIASGGGGGSGYVYTSSTASSYPSGCLLNNSHYLTNASTTAGSSSFPSTTSGTETGHSGDGYARVVYNP